MQPPYTDEEERKIKLVKGLMENAIKEMERLHNEAMDKMEREWLDERLKADKLESGNLKPGREYVPN